MGKFHARNGLLSVLFSFTFLIISLNVGLSQCPTIQFVDLRGTPGFPQTDNLNVCGQPDTLSILMFTDAPGQVKGFEFTVNMVSGMRYAGFEEAHYGGCTDLSNTDPDVNSPSFVGAGLTCGDIFVANIGVTADCSVDLVSNDYTIEIDYSYTYFPPTGGFIKCKGTEILDNDFNGAIKESVLNMFTPTPIDVTVGSIGSPYCQTMRISQDGLQAYLNELEFAVCGIDLGAASPISVTSMTANGIDIFGGATYNPADTSLTTTIDASIFPSNGSTNPFGTAEQFDTDEKVTIEVCYEVANCPDGADIPFTYKAWYGCFDEVCQITGKASFLKVRPSGSADAIITASLNNGLQICGDDAVVTGTIQNGNADDTDQNVYTDLSIGFQGCGIPVFSVTEVVVNGVNVPAVWTVIGDDIDISFEMNTDATIGLVDYDGDGFFDDLPGGSDALDVVVKFNISCSDPSAPAGECVDINCDAVQFYVSGKTNCGNGFQDFPDTDPFGLQFGADTVTNPDDDDLNSTGTVVGYNFGRFGNPDGPATKEITFCYDFSMENIEGCSVDPDIMLKVVIAGADHFTSDVEYVPGTAMYDDGTGFTPVADAMVSMTYPMPGEAVFVIDFGDGNAAGEVCYKYQLEFEDARCAPPAFLAVSQQVSSICSVCDPDCEILIACKGTLFRVDAQDTGCPCLARHTSLSAERVSFGYKDKAMSEKWTKDELVDAGCAVDLGRFMPGDTLQYRSCLEILSEDVLKDPNAWANSWSYYPVSGGELNMERIPLIIDAAASVLDTIRVENADGSIHIVDIGSLADCMASGSSTYYQSNFSTFGETPWGADYTGNQGCTGISGYNTYDFRDNQYLQFSLVNYGNIDECVGSWRNFADGNCLDEFISTYGITLNSKIFYTFRVPLVKNPHREMAIALGIEPPIENAVRIYPASSFSSYDPIAGSVSTCSAAVGSACVTQAVFNVTCAGELAGKTDIILNNCGGTVEHTLYVKELPGTPGDPWFTKEYRPAVIDLELSSPIYAPLAYCGGAVVDQNGVLKEVFVDSTSNMNCSPVAGYADDLCSVASGSSGNVVFDLGAQGVKGLGVGLDNCDTIKLSYDYCLLCPTSPSAGLLEYALLADYSSAGHRMDECSQAKFHGTLIATSHPSYNAYASRTHMDEFGLTGGIKLYNVLMWDTIYCKDDSPFPVLMFKDSIVPAPGVTATNVDGQDLIAAESAGTSIEWKEIELCNPGDMDANGFSGYVTVPNAVSFGGVCLVKDDPTSALVTTLISDDGQIKKYQIDMQQLL